MAGRLRLLAVPLLLVLVPSAALGLIGHKWLRLEGLQEAQRSREAAVEEGTRLREDLFARWAAVAVETGRAWGNRDAGSAPFASPHSHPIS